jgi:hypothetical protein
MTTVRHRPVHGTCRWALQPTATHPGCLVIGDQAYLVRAITDRLGLVGYRLSKTSGEVYDLTADLASCDCPDATFRPGREGGCKHKRALAAALAALKKGGA